MAASYKTLVYGAAAFVVPFAEKLFHAYRETGRLGIAVMECGAPRDRNAILADAIRVALTFLGYHRYPGIDRRLGEGTRRRMLWRPGRAPMPNIQADSRPGARRRVHFDRACGICTRRIGDRDAASAEAIS